MKEFATDYRQLNNDDLLQLWVERAQLVDEAKEALREEIRRRGIEREAELAVDRRAEPFSRTGLPLRRWIYAIADSMQAKRPLVVAVAATAQSVIAIAVLFVWLAFAFWGAGFGSILVATALLGWPLFFSIRAAKGLWRGTAAGWWTAVVFDLTVGVAVAAWSLLNNMDFHDIVESVLFLVLCVLLLLPTVRRFYGIPHKPTTLLSGPLE
jgi:cation transport ATPase